MNKFTSFSIQFSSTGCFHSAAMVENNEIAIFYDDIGRHNAIDKVVGSIAINNSGFSNKILLTTGRVPVEIIQKVIHTGIKVIISKSPPTFQAVNIASKNDITLIGFVRNNKMNIYSGIQRLIF